MYKNLLVHVDNSRACRARVAAALALADRFEASLLGLGIIPDLDMSVYADVPIAVSVVEEQLAMLEADAAAAADIFSRETQSSTVPAQWMSARGSPLENLRRATPYADLTLVGQHDPDDPRCSAGGLAEALAMHGGGPVLVLPHTGSTETVGPIGRTALVAWNGSSEAGRAVRDAVPFLTAATRVEVVRIAESAGEPLHPHDLERVCEGLGRHGVRASGKSLMAEEDEGQTLLAYCASSASDLLVMGAYGHSRIQELILGGVTRAVVRGHRVPLLLSH